MRRVTMFIVAGALAATPVAAEPKVTTQACLGSVQTFLSCPAGAQRSGTECRARGDHWSGSMRQGPALFLRDDREPDPAKQRVSFAASYTDHKKTGRVFHFDADGKLESWTDVFADRYHGLSVSCLPDGRVSHLAYYKDDRLVGISRSWRTRDGGFASAFQYDASGRGTPVQVSPALQQRPDSLCQPAACDVRAKPDLSGVP
jgi:hypothetical protein